MSPTSLKAFAPPLESRLVARLCELLPTTRLAPRGTIIRRELVVGGSVADVVLLLPSTRRPQFPPGLSAGECVFLSRVRRNGSATIDIFANGSRGSRSVRRLFESGLLQQDDSGAVSATTRWWGSRSVIAIEGKLLRWRDALEQASKYRAYADEAYVALPESTISQAQSNICAFLTAGVGLLSVSHSSLRVVTPPQRSFEHDWRREFVYSRLTPLEGGLDGDEDRGPTR